MSPVLGRAGAVAGLAVAAAAASAAVGLAAQRRAARSILRRDDPEAGEDLAAPMGDVRVVETDDGAHLSVEVSSTRSSSDLTLVLIHGYALAASTWHYQFRDLADAARLVAYDQRGHGRSTVGADALSVDRLAADLETVIEAVVPDGPIVLVGHSMGGMSVMALAERRPEWFGERIVGTALLATSAHPGAAGELAIAGPWGEILRRIGPGLASVLAPRPQLVERGLSIADDLVVVLTEHYGFGSQAPPSLVEHTKHMHAQVPVEVLAGLLPAFEDLDLADALAPLQHTDIVIVVGETDRMTPPRLSEKLLQLLPAADLVTLADTGHMLMLERYPEVNQVLRDLMVRVRRSLGAA
jgi:pimeloyl-ACP methyl ester carboxylesterase